ncbi:MAG: AAA family ATPase [Verrucomicrobia bacterium]|nr:AAA family ATPase [Verrucomicrobiota bacterium]
MKNPPMSRDLELEKQDGTARFFQRRKGNKDTLLDQENKAMPEANLKDFLGGVDEAYFDSMFGLGSEELRQGADSLLRGEGRLGEALFSASLGGTPVDKVIQSLEAEAAKSFRGRAGASIRTTRKQLDECLKLAKDSVIKPEAWDEVQQALEQRTSQHRILLEERQALFIRKAWLERCRDALPVVGQWRECLKQLAELPEMPDLSEKFGESIKQTRADWQTAQNQIEPTEIQIAGLQTQVAACQLAPQVLAEQSEIDRLHTGIAVYRNQKQTLAKKRTEAEQAKLHLAVTCRELEITTPLAELEPRRLSQVKLLEAEQNARTLATATENLNAAKETAEALQKEIDRLRQQRTPVDTEDLQALEKAFGETKNCEDLANGLAARITTAETTRRKLEALRSQLPGCPEDLQQIRTSDVPLKATIERFRESFDELKRQDQDLEKRKADEQAKVDKVTAELARLNRQRNLPSLEDLSGARIHREHGWNLVLKDWKGGGADGEFVAGLPLEEAYPNAVVAADDLADRLRTEAEAVARLEEKGMQLVLAEKALAEIQQQQDLAVEAKTALDAKWTKAWESCNVNPLSPREMMEWRESWEEFGRQWDQWSTDTKRISQDEEAVVQAVAVLKSVLPIKEDQLSVLLSAARTKIDRHNRAVGADSEVLRQIANKETDRQEITGKLPGLQAAAANAQTAWNACRIGLSLPEALEAEAAVGLLRSRKDLFVEYDRWISLTNECEALDGHITSYEGSLSQLGTALKLESRGVENDEAELWKRLDSARKAQARFEDLQVQLPDKETELALLRQQARQTREAFDSMLLAASLKHEDALDGFIQHFEEKKRIDERVRTLRDSLAGFSRGEAVDDFIGRVEQEDGAELDGSLSVIDGRVTETETALEAVRNEAQEYSNQRKGMENASDESAKQAQLAELATARIQRDGERFVRLHLAISLLKSRIDRFREQNQGPFMEKASHWFSEITGAAFSGITTSYDAGDKPVIAGQRAGDSANRTVAVEGMSEGTRDQLFLALRLAGLELHLAEHEAMPLILDDLLVHFDDARSLHALTALHAFGQRSQVLLFTHHAHLVQLAESHWGQSGFHLHRLAGPNGGKEFA